MFPTNSYNSPMGYQFGRENAEFIEENGINPNLWDDALTEQSYEQTPTARYDSVREATEQAESIAQASRVEAQAYAAPIEQEFSREQAVADAHELSTVGMYVRRNRNGVRMSASEYGLVA